MVYQFKCSCQESKLFQLEIEADASHSFYELHQAIQEALGFQSFHLASFFLTQGKSRRQVEITQLGRDKSNNHCFNMRRTLIGDMLLPEKRFLRYVFDFINDRYIQLELTGTIMEKNLREPVVKLNIGKSPVQELEEGLTDELLEPVHVKNNDSDYGIVDDYYEIFGEMEEYVV